MKGGAVPPPHLFTFSLPSAHSLFSPSSSFRYSTPLHTLVSYATPLPYIFDVFLNTSS